jgi:hypothetical protein
MLAKSRGRRPLQSISERQKFIINKAWLDDSARIATAGSWRALQLDLALFGDEAKHLY